MKASVELCINKLSDPAAKSELQADWERFESELGQLRTPDDLADSYACQVAMHGVLEGHRKVGKPIIPLHTMGDRSECTNYWGISLLSLPGKVYAKCLVKRCREIIEPKLIDSQCGFRSGRNTTEQNSTLQQIFGKSWEHAKD